MSALHGLPGRLAFHQPFRQADIPGWNGVLEPTVSSSFVASQNAPAAQDCPPATVCLTVVAGAIPTFMDYTEPMMCNCV